jgi:hypothetical protein
MNAANKEIRQHELEDFLDEFFQTQLNMIAEDNSIPFVCTQTSFFEFLVIDCERESVCVCVCLTIKYIAGCQTSGSTT